MYIALSWCRPSMAPLWWAAPPECSPSLHSQGWSLRTLASSDFPHCTWESPSSQAVHFIWFVEHFTEKWKCGLEFFVLPLLLLQGRRKYPIEKDVSLDLYQPWEATCLDSAFGLLSSPGDIWMHLFQLVPNHKALLGGHFWGIILTRLNR